MNDTDRLNEVERRKLCVDFDNGYLAWIVSSPDPYIGDCGAGVDVRSAIDLAIKNLEKEDASATQESS